MGESGKMLFFSFFFVEENVEVYFFLSLYLFFFFLCGRKCSLGEKGKKLFFLSFSVISSGVGGERSIFSSISI